MLDFLNLEKQAGKRVKNLLVHKSTAAGIPVETAKLVINLRSYRLKVYLYSSNFLVREIEIWEITDFFGKLYDEAKIIPVREYVMSLAESNGIEYSSLNVIICEIKKEMGCFLYNEMKYVKRISTIELLTKFNSIED
jgi:hypothetical protein